MPVLFADLHVHSIYSDGTFFPEDIANLARNKGLKAVAITDHDTVVEAGIVDGLTVIPAIELSTQKNIDGKLLQGLHILGYNFNVAAMKSKVESARQSKLNAIKQCADNFNMLSFDSLNNNIFRLNTKPRVNLKMFFEFNCGRALTVDQYEFLLRNCAPTKIDFAEFLCETCFEYNPALQSAYGDPYKLFKKEFARTIFKTQSDEPISPEMAIKIIKELGGLAVLAHPAAPCMIEVLSENWHTNRSTDTTFLTFIAQLRESGLDGLEIYNYHGIMKYSPQVSEKINKYFMLLSKKLGLLNTWGSDCHGDQWWGVQVGTFGATANEIAPFLAMLKSRYSSQAL